LFQLTSFRSGYAFFVSVLAASSMLSAKAGAEPSTAAVPASADGAWRAWRGGAGTNELGRNLHKQAAATAAGAAALARALQAQVLKSLLVQRLVQLQLALKSNLTKRAAFSASGALAVELQWTPDGGER